MAVLTRAWQMLLKALEEVPLAPNAMMAAEMALIYFAGHGVVRLRRISESGRRGIEIEVVDTGPGIADCEAAMQDHYSSGGTLGLGLPGVKRMMDEFSLESTIGEGTRVTARKWI